MKAIILSLTENKHKTMVKIREDNYQMICCADIQIQS